MIGELHLSSQVAFDGDGAVGSLYRVSGLPATVFVRADGSVEGTFRGQLTTAAAQNHLAALAAGE